MNRVHLQPCYLLHHRPYRDTSFIVDLFSQQYGYCSAVAQGVRTTRSNLKALLQPFMPLLLSWSGNSELVRITNAEANGLAHQLEGKYLISGFYLNELLLRTLHKFEPHPQLFELYRLSMAALNEKNPLQPILRIFEKNLLDELGYAIAFDYCRHTEKRVEPEESYQFIPLEGISHLPAEKASLVKQSVFKGSSLLAIAQGQFTTQQQLQDAKQIMRLALAPLIGNKPLKSRELLRQMHFKGDEY